MSADWLRRRDVQLGLGAAAVALLLLAGYLAYKR